MDASTSRTKIVMTRGMTSQRWDPPRRLDDRGGIAITLNHTKTRRKRGPGAATPGLSALEACAQDVDHRTSGCQVRQHGVGPET